MKKSSIFITALLLVLGTMSSSYANVYATNIEVSAEVITTGATNTTVDISFLLNEDADSGVDVNIYSGASLVRTISLATATKGSNSVTWDGTDAGGATLPDGDYSFEITASDDGHTEWTKISDPLKTVMYSPKGVVVNRNPDSEYFGRVYISNGYAGTSANTGAFYNGDGIFIFSAAQDSLDFQTGGVDWTNSSESPGKTSIGLDDRVYVTDYGRDELWSFDANIDALSSALIIDADNKEAGDYVSGNWVTGSGADRAIYTANMHYGAYRGIVKYDLGLNDVLPANDTGVEIIARPNGLYYQGDVEVDAAGNIYFTQYRAAAGQAFPLLKYPPYTGTQLTLDDTLWTVPKSAFNAKGLALDEARNRVVWASEYTGDLVIHNATTGAIMDTLVTGQSRNKDVAFDAVGNMYTIDNGTEYWNVWSSPDGANSFTTPGLATITIETPPLGGDVLINEFDTNTSSLEYIELYNTTDLAIDLATEGYVLAFVNGYDDEVYQATELTGSIPANGFFVIAESGVTDIGGYTPDQNGTWTSFQNGTDGVALVKGAAAADFPGNATYSIEYGAISGAVQEDAIIYDDVDADTGLETEFGLPGILIISGSAGSSARITDGQGGPNYANADWEIAAIRTPGVSNVLPPQIVSSFSISDTEIEVLYSDAPAAIDVANYFIVGTAGVTFASATIDAGNTSLVHLVATAAITADAVADTLMDDNTMSSFVLNAGITPIAFTNALNPGGTIAQDVPTTIAGLVTANDGYNNVWVNDGNGAYMGVLLFDYDFDGLVAVGDEVMFVGTLDVYNNLSELKNIELLGIQSSDNPTFPAMISGSEIDSSLAADTNPAEQWEGQLVQIDSATVLAYDAGTYTYELSDDAGVTKFLVGDNVDYHLGVVSLNVGTAYDIVGVVDYTSGNYRVNPRNMDDVVDLSILPSIISVMSLSDTEIDVVYSLEVGAVDVADYSITGTPVTFTSATIDAENAMLVHLVASAAITADVITDTLMDAANADTVLLYAGVSPIAFTNTLNPGGVFELGIPATFSGLVIADDEYNNVWVNDNTGAYNGVLLYDYDIGDTLDVGDQVVFSGDRDVYNNLSELKHIKLIEHTSSDNPTIPSLITGATIDSSLAADTNPAEQWEGQLVKIDSALVLAYDGTGYRYELSADGGVTSFLVGDDVDYHFGNISMNVGSMYNLVGVVSYYYGHYIISPRNMDDLMVLDIAGPELAGIVAVSETEVQVRFSEAITSADAMVLTNFSVSDGIGNPTAVTMINDFTYLLTVAAMAPNMDYTLTVNGIHDMLGNAIATDAMIGFMRDVPGSLFIDRIMNDFTVDVGHWAHPTYSGSTSGLLATSTFAPSDSLAFVGTHSGEMVLLDNPAIEGGWFVRLWNINRVDRIDADSKMFFYLRGGNADIQARIVVKDDDGYEAGPWQDVTHAEDDWQVISVDLANDVMTGWINGNSTINAAGGSVAIDGIQIKCSEDVSTTLFINSVTERYNIDPVEVTFNVDMSVQTLLEKFAPASDFVDVAGNFNNWGGNAIVLTDTGADSIYTTTLAGVYPGQTLEYKFRINGSWSDDTAEFPFGGSARLYVVPDTNSVVFHWYNDVDTYVSVDGLLIPQEYALYNNYPNPFNPITNIKYDIPENTYVRLSIYNTLGQHVVDLVNEDQAPGFYHLQWNGLSKHGTPVSSGMFIYRLTTPEFSKSGKMTYLK